MEPAASRLAIRPFRPEDAEACFKIRAEAYIREFYHELGPEGVVAGVNAFMPGDYVSMAETMPTFVAEQNGGAVGFSMVRLLDATTAELLLIYVSVARLGQGIGTRLAQHAEAWLAENRPQVTQMLVDTVIPQYNQAFYEKLGYEPVGEHPFQFPDRMVRSVRLRKELT